MQIKRVEAPILAIGLMSGTSLDGIDAALIRTGGEGRVDILGSLTIPYDMEFQQRLRAAIAGTVDATLEKDLTEKHAEAVKALLTQEQREAEQVNVIGFHGQTTMHKPHEGITVQMGDGALLAKLTGIDVVNDFRSNDVKLGGQGAPLVPIYHQALMRHQSKPVAVLNIGGVANVTWIGEHEDDLLAFDTGPGNALINDWVHQHTGKNCDMDGLIASRGEVDKAQLQQLLSHPYFSQMPPKSLDRNSFATSLNSQSFYPPPQAGGISVQDGAATLTAFTAASVVKAAEFFPKPVKSWFVCGGGRHNKTLMGMVQRQLNVPVHTIDTLDINGDTLEAEAFAYLAVRSLRGLPLSFPKTTGVSHAAIGGVFYRA